MASMSGWGWEKRVSTLTGHPQRYLLPRGKLGEEMAMKVAIMVKGTGVGIDVAKGACYGC